jgi:hypothetical protein
MSAFGPKRTCFVREGEDEKRIAQLYGHFFCSLTTAHSQIVSVTVVQVLAAMLENASGF